LYSNSANFLLGKIVYDKNELFKYLKSLGYSFSIYSQLQDKKLLTGFGALGVLRPDMWLRKQTIERVYLSPWMQVKLENLFGRKNTLPSSIRNSFSAYHQYNLDAIQHIKSDCERMNIDEKKPVFSYTHIMMPHDPYIVDENGKMVSNPQPENSDMAGYLRQVKYCNKVIKQIIDCLLKDTTRNKIIIIHGDHGFRHYSNAPDIAQFGALEAIYFYNKNYTGLTKKENLVNIYRIVLNKFFGGTLALLPYQSFELKEN
jgi:hypothetical protein